jgi:tetratricopeptide (TPR) repeat protein
MRSITVTDAHRHQRSSQRDVRVLFVSRRTVRATTFLALIAFAACIAHAMSLAGGFVWLDHAHLEDGLAITSLGHAGRLFTTGFAGTGFYRPLMALSLSLDAAVAGVGAGAPWLFHLTSLLWHAAAAVMVILAARSLGLVRPAPEVAGLLFAVHPAGALVADAIAFRSEAMIAVALLALIVFHQRRRPLPAALALLAGALTKETALVLAPLFIVALELPDERAEPSASSRARLWAAEAAAFALALGLRLGFAPAWRAGFVALDADQAVGTRLASLAKSAGFLLLPIVRTICDAFPIRSMASPAALAGAVVLIGLGLLAYRRRGPALLLALAVLPALNLVPIMRWWSPHYLYVPLAFAAMLAAEAGLRAGRRGLVAAGVVAVVWAGLSLSDGRRFASDAALWAPEVAAQPACREGHFYLAEVERQGRHFDAAADHYERALAPTTGIISYVDRSAALQNLGVVRIEQNRPDEARAALHAALDLVTQDEPRRRLTHNLAAAELRFGNAAEAARLLAPEVARPDALPESIFLGARALHQLGREAEAGALLRRLPGN